MMMHEFIARTNYHPTEEEYAVIEEAYYDFRGDKNEFCKWWLDAKKRGYWDRERLLRLAVNDLTEEVETLQQHERELKAHASSYLEDKLRAELKLKKVKAILDL